MTRALDARVTQPGLHQQLMAAGIAIEAVLRGQSLSAALEHTPKPLRPAAQALSFHAMRHLGLARALRALMVPKTPGCMLVDALLLLGLSLLETSLQAAAGEPLPPGAPRYAAHTVVHQMVAAAASERRTRPAGNLINAILRRYGRERKALQATVADQPEARWNHPQWWIDALRQAWPDDWQALLHAANQMPPMTLRANRRRIGRDALRAQLQQQGLAARPVLQDGLILESPRPVHEIPGHAQGLWSVQDASAQRAAALLPLRPGARVLDACAAPGGKTAHLLEHYDLDLTALDQDAVRLDRIADNLKRLGLFTDSIRICQGDARTPEQWWDGEAYDAILADVPCTASGVVRRHPDIRWLRRASDLARTARLQAEILRALWPVLRPGGHLLYVTCSIFPQEGEQQIQDFLQHGPQARRLAAPGHLLPGGADDGDGFFYALLQKAP
ncbi:16S rRNA (cytosine(967)-C(5))-methyltransferase RsmB [Castellaniella sp.]|uniref:16S rRNA (cytosine(967)-C(5))-methyltransferase RsmB n=1 Tax=Castellaniella sp. TaxID=1955812 RepID=UPI00355D63E8